MTQKVEQECTHRWKTCPVHSSPNDELPSFRTIITCIYGGAKLKDGGTWDETTSNEVVDRLFKRLAP